MEKQNILTAIGVPKIDEIFGHPKFQEAVNDFEVIEEREHLIPRLAEIGDMVDILYISDALPGKTLLVDLLPKIKVKFPNVRIVYLTSDASIHDQSRMQTLSFLTILEIYDIIAATKISPKSIYRSIIQPAVEEDVSWIQEARGRFAKELESKLAFVEIEQTEESEIETDDEGFVFENTAVFSSIKPGTGKSFISANVALAIARYGAKNKHGNAPRVALIDADLQNLSLGTLLQIPDDKNNLKAAIDQIHSVIDSSGNITGDGFQEDEAKRHVRNSFVPYVKQKNLNVLAGSQLSIDQLAGITSSDFMYLLQTIKDDYDVIILDSNSSLAHVSTITLLSMGKDIFYILNLDFNNVRNNSRYFKTLEDLGVSDKVKYILNENITQEYLDKHQFSEDLKYTEDHVRESGFDLAGSVPMVEKPVFLNHIYDGTPIILDKEDYTLEARLEILRIANQLWEIETLPQVEDKFLKLKEAKEKPKRRGLFG